MKLIMSTAVMVSLALGLSLPLSAETVPLLLAETKVQPEVVDKNPPPASTEPSEEMEGKTEGEDPEAESSAETTPPVVESLTVQHRIKDETLPKQTIEADPFVFLKTLKEDLLAQLGKRGKPLTVDTDVAVVLSEDWSQDLGGPLPSLTMKTTVNEQGQGQSEFALPAFKRETSGEQEKAVIDWKGLQGQLTFTDKFEGATATVNAEGWRVAEGKSFAELGKITLKSELDTDLLPVNLQFNLPSFKFSEASDQVQFNVEGLVFEGKMEKSKNDLYLSQGRLSVSQVNVTQENSKGSLSQFDLKGNSELQGDVVRYLLNTKIGQLSLPKEVLDEKLDMSYIGNFELRRLDATVVADIQKTLRELRKQQAAGAVSTEMLGLAIMGKVMEVLPKLLAKSPELALTELNLKSEQGSLQGKATVGVNGKKASVLKDLNELMMAVQAQADFSMTKALVEKIMIGMIYEELSGAESAKDKKPDEAILHKNAEKAGRERIKEYLAKKYFVEAGDNYQIVASFQEGQLTLNGQTIKSPSSLEATPNEETEAPSEEGPKK